MGGESEDLGFAAEVFCRWFTLFQECQFRNILFLFGILAGHEKHLSFHPNMGVCRWREVHPGASLYAPGAPFAHLNLSLELVCCKMGSVSSSFSWSLIARNCEEQSHNSGKEMEMTKKNCVYIYIWI